mmetsp:Transcript_6253/g.18879  ORF Transcript_6253/g.18879 Transcript_6253/m.18879 type:complete len:84 (+) Transcript_6253:718-969(+)
MCIAAQQGPPAERRNSIDSLRAHAEARANHVFAATVWISQGSTGLARLRQYFLGTKTGGNHDQRNSVSRSCAGADEEHIGKLF